MISSSLPSMRALVSGLRTERSSRRDAAGCRAIFLVAVFAMAFVAGCEDKIPPPPEDDKPAAPESNIDLEHMARFRADRETTFTNCVLVWQPDPIDSAASALSLTTSRAALDGSRFIFGTFVDALTLERLMQSDVDFAGSSILDVRGNGVFTPTAFYQPRSVRMKIEKLDDGSVEGVLSGAFYRFRLVRPTAKPDPIEAELRFKAKLMDR